MNDIPQKDLAIHAALTQNWTDAIKINLAIIKEEKTNTEAHNRLGFAYLKNGQIKKAKEAFEKTIKLDPYNQIAAKNLKKLHTVKKSGLLSGSTKDISPLLFLEEPGKTKIVECINPAPMNCLVCLSCGQEVYLKAKKHTIEIRDAAGVYIGAIPDDVAFKLLKFIAAGNMYQTYVKGVAKNCVTVFIREVKRGKKLLNQPSFIGSTNYLPYQQHDGIHASKPRVVKEDEEEGNDSEQPEEE